VTGPYDVVVLAQVNDLRELAKLVDTGIQAVDGVTRTMTCVVHE
jgi:DNA-binding Lrp family transcriptional regulator